ncbi:MAG TPA: c-type cytochrome [Verrucomicrobiae bacterium]|jgi:mono/diheme cytochrome c family protein|nr:c-type cytochrome [Verrucomicrobiae bacterium]
MREKNGLLWLSIILAFSVCSLKAAASNSNLLAWDSVHKEIVCKPGEKFAHFAFSVTNVSASDVVILGTATSCGCTVARLPAQPWILKPQASGQIEVTVDLTNKVGTVKKAVFVTISNAPMETLSVTATISLLFPPPPMMSNADRIRNVQMAKANAQAIFKGNCASCHMVPAKGKTGAALYSAMCGICHDAGLRQASMVPHLRNLKKPTGFAFWKNTVANGVTNSLMPSFAEANGGPLTEAQINSLADYLDKSISQNSSVLQSASPAKP